jgi:two-component system cell cycle sensor histidine kinase/response regulator CckA
MPIRRALPLSVVILVAAIPVVLASAIPAPIWLHHTLVLMSGLLVVASALHAVNGLLQGAKQRVIRQTVAAMLGDDPADCCTADLEGRILARHPAPANPLEAPPTVAAALGPLLVDAEGVVDRLQAEALLSGRADATLSTRRGPVRLTAQWIEHGTMFWRAQAPNLVAPPEPEVPLSPSGRVWDEIEDLPVPLLKLAPSGLILAANRPARALLPMLVNAEVRLSDLLEGLGRPVIEWIADVAEGRPTSGPQVLRGRGEHHDTILRVTLGLAGPAADRHLVAILDDVSAFKALEAQFVQSQKMQALGQLAGGVAHDFNNLLTAISGHCDLLLLRHDQGDVEYADLIQIRQNVNRAASLVGQLLAFSRKQSMMPETIDLRLALSDLTHLLNRLVGERVRLALHHDPTTLHVRADKRQLEQVVMNLVVNARDAMPEGGEIRIETSGHRLNEPLVRDRATIPPGRYVIVTVSDQGTGIPPERLPKIFEPFYTTKKPGEGTGLGLSTAYGIIKQTGGFIFAESEVGRGTIFTLWFPAHDRPRDVAAPEVRRPLVSRKAEGVVLLVEDEAPVRAFAVRALRLRGYTVLEADCAEAALAVLSDPAVAVDLIFTDVILPDMDGPTWVRKALGTRPGVRVIFASGYAEDAFAEQKALIPGSVFLPKPFSLVELTTVVDRQLSQEKPGSPPTLVESA